MKINFGNKPAKDFNWGWETATYFDLWSIQHLMTGFAMGFLLTYLGINTLISWTIAFLVGLGWEFFEDSIRMHETFLLGSIMDIFYSQLGFLIAFYLIDLPHKANLLTGIAIMLGVMFWGIYSWSLWLKKYGNTGLKGNKGERLLKKIIGE